MNNSDLEIYLTKFLKRDLTAFLSSKPEPTAIRLNTLKTNLLQLQRRLQEWGVAFRKIPFSKNGFIIENDFIPLSHTLDFFLGRLQYQSAASQLPPIALDPKPGQKILDLAAAPGSKATQIAAMMENSGFLILNDISKKRLRSLNSNVQKAGLINQVILHLPGEQYGNLFPNYFDKVLLDAPCTALGTLADKPEVSRWWSYAKLKKLSDLQKRLFISAFKALKTGGEIVYSTCSIAPEENELLIQSMLDTYPLKILEIKQFDVNSFSKGLTSYEGKDFHPDMDRAVRVMPHIHDIEGFFVIKLLKTADHKIHNMRKQMDFNPTLKFNDEMIVEDLENISEQWGIPQTIWGNYRYVRKKGRILLIHSDIENLPADGFVHAGIPLAEKRISGWKLTNQSVQFLGNLITKNRIELDAPQMKALFSGAGVKLDGVSDGYHALEWEGLPIASLYAENGNIKLRLPHLFRLEL